MENNKNQTAVFAGGCFWCTEAIFEELRGVVSVTPGYTGGTLRNPSYDAVCTGTTGHAEATKIEFDPTQIKFQDLLTVFFATHDPITLNRQGNDIGTQYRSAIFYSSEEQKAEAEMFIKNLEAADPGGRPIVTKVVPLGEFYFAEDYHRQYFKNHPETGYCQIIIEPKVQKMQQHFGVLLKSASK